MRDFCQTPADLDQSPVLIRWSRRERSSRAAPARPDESNNPGTNQRAEEADEKRRHVTAKYQETAWLTRYRSILSP
jgi:hypothetical protein